jgi:hypothetical protein
MIKRTLFAVLVLVLMTGCSKPKSIKPGEAMEINRTQQIYFGVMGEALLPDTQKYVETLSEAERINFLVVHTGGQYLVLPEDVLAALLDDTAWITPAGVSVEAPSVTLEPADIIWKETYGNQETTKTVKGYQMVIHARIVASANAESGDVILKMPQFKALELGGLYVVKVLGGQVLSGSAHVLADSDTYVVAVVE